MMKKLTYLILFCLSFTIIIHSQNKNKFKFDFDYAQFAYDTASNYVEFYYAFNQKTMKLVQDSSLQLHGMLEITMTDSSTGKQILNKKWKINTPIQDTSAINKKSLVGLVSFIIPKGTYNCVLSGSDGEDTSNKKVIKELIHVKPFWGKDMAVSDIELASKILQNSKDKSSIFYKNTFEVTPLPTEVFGENLPVVFYYCELYSLGNTRKDSLLKVVRIVANSRGKIVSRQIKSIHNTVKSRVEVGTFPVNKLPTDTYTMIVSLLDSASQKGVSTSKRFFVYNPGIKNTDTASSGNTGILSSVFGVMSLEECNDLFAKSKYIASGKEVKEWAKLDSVGGKRAFLYKFWKRRDADPSTPQNQYFQSYLKRIQESNRKFGTISRPGWKTDRGRVYLKYGEPSEIDRYPNQTDTKPYEIWHYNDLEGGVIFVFADLTGFSDYQLIHSTMRGELRDDNWQSRVSTF